MAIPVANIDNWVIVPFIIVFFLCWFAFCALLIFKPHSWMDFQNRQSKKYGFEWRIVDDKKFVEVNKKAGFWLIVLGVCVVLIVTGFISGIIPLMY